MELLNFLNNVQDGSILEEWAGRTVINSCAQLAYGNAQAVIDAGCAGPPPPRTIHGDHSWQQARSLTVHLRKRLVLSSSWG